MLIPFAFFNKTAFLAEKVLGNVVSSGVKIMMLAVIVSIGQSLFAQFTAGFGKTLPDMGQALSLVGLAIFGPGIANGLISGEPQLGAGAAARAGASLAGATSTAYSLGSAGQSGAADVASGLGGVARTGAGKVGQTVASPFRRAAASMKDGFVAGGHAVVGEAAPAEAAADPVPAASGRGGPPAWAKRMKRGQQLGHGVQSATHAVKSGDSHGGGTAVSLDQGDR
ncbi:Conjugative transfer protein TrbL [Candidatus Paraburkholderia calva]|nr:Conjugative transfer protein TrbL [Candidatus Paraburkholderia calva]